METDDLLFGLNVSFTFVFPRSRNLWDSALFRFLWPFSHAKGCVRVPSCPRLTLIQISAALPSVAPSHVRGFWLNTLPSAAKSWHEGWSATPLGLPLFKFLPLSLRLHPFTFMAFDWILFLPLLNLDTMDGVLIHNRMPYKICLVKIRLYKSRYRFL